MKRYTPDPAATVTALAGRIDLLERRLTELDQLRTDVTALGRGMGDVAGQIRSLAAAINVPTGSGASEVPGQPGISGTGTGPIQGTEGDPGEGDGQPDWLTVTDPATASAWLVSVNEWSQAILGPLGVAPAVRCWPLHPLVVVELLALSEQHACAYSGENPTGVSEWLGRWLPGAATRMAQHLRPCAQDQAHFHHGRSYEIPWLDLSVVASWWADTHGHTPDAVNAFALTLAA